MSARSIRTSSAIVALLVILALLLPMNSVSSAALLSLAPASSDLSPTLTTVQRPLAELLRPDGTLDLQSDYRGSIDATGWRLAGDGAAPRFVPAITSAALGDEYWADGFAFPGIIGYVYALAADGAGNLYAGGSFTAAGGVSANDVAKWDGTAWTPLGSGIGGVSSPRSTPWRWTAPATCTPGVASPRPARSVPITSPNGTARPGRPWAVA